jgi:hypothetical protein
LTLADRHGGRSKSCFHEKKGKESETKQQQMVRTIRLQSFFVLMSHGIVSPQWLLVIEIKAPYRVRDTEAKCGSAFRASHRSDASCQQGSFFAEIES